MWYKLGVKISIVKCYGRAIICCLTVWYTQIPYFESNRPHKHINRDESLHIIYLIYLINIIILLFNKYIIRS